MSDISVMSDIGHFGHEIPFEGHHKPGGILVGREHSGFSSTLDFLVFLLQHFLEVIRPHEVDDSQPQSLFTLDNKQRIVDDLIFTQKQNIFLQTFVDFLVEMLIHYIRLVIFINFKVSVQSCELCFHALWDLGSVCLRTFQIVDLYLQEIELEE
jgi:hypothetical protein